MNAPLPFWRAYKWDARCGSSKPSDCLAGPARVVCKLKNCALLDSLRAVPALVLVGGSSNNNNNNNNNSNNDDGWRLGRQ